MEARAIGGADKEHAAGRRHRTALIKRAGIRDALCLQLIHAAERKAPRNLAGIVVDRAQLSPGRGIARPTRFRI